MHKGLEINENKTKYLKADKNKRRTEHELHVNEYKFETMDNFV